MHARFFITVCTFSMGLALAGLPVNGHAAQQSAPSDKGKIKKCNSGIIFGTFINAFVSNNWKTLLKQPYPAALLFHVIISSFSLFLLPHPDQAMYSYLQG